MKPEHSVLIIEDDLQLARSAVRSLTQMGYKASYVENGSQAFHAFEKDRFDAIVTDFMLPDSTGIDILKAARDRKAAKVAVMVSGSPSFDVAVQAMQLGAMDFLTKPYDPAKLEAILRASLDPKQVAEMSLGSGNEIDSWRARYAPEIVGRDPAILRVMETIRRVADVDSNVLILGESGTGKELMARVIHRASHRGQGPFIPLNCAAIPESLVESELFGHTKGAFTGANTAKMGRFQAANRGTIFLDEIGEMNLPVQAKVLRVIQEREVTPVGDNSSQKIDVRVVAATHRDLKTEVAERRFREDLYFRLNVIPLRIPPLRERRSDLPLLIECVIKRVNETSGRAVTKFSDASMAMMLEHDWPGNVRELENTVERLVILKGSGDIDEHDMRDIDFMPKKLGPAQAPSPIVQVSADTPAMTSDGLDLKSAVEQYEGQLILAALKATNGNQKKAAELLKINRTTLIEKMRRMGLRPAAMA